jgi:predicted RNase H-like HicB family nuclease
MRAGGDDMAVQTFSAVLHKEGDLYVAECPEVGTVSQGYTIEEAVTNLKEATELYLEEFPPHRELAIGTLLKPRKSKPGGSEA